MISLNVDIVVIGAGAAGLAAAVAASEQGKKVVVLEKQAYSGGKAIGAQVGTICGLFHQSRDSKPHWLVSGYPKAFAEKILKTDAAALLSTEDGLHFIRYQVAPFQGALEAEFQTHQIEVWYHTTVLDVLQEHGSIQQITVLNNNQETRLACSAVIDCSGESVVAKHLKLDLITAAVYQAASRIFTIEGLSIETEDLLKINVWRAIGRGVFNGELGAEYKKIYLLRGSLHHGTASFKLTIPIDVTHSDKNLLELKTCSTELIERFVAFLSKQQGFESVRLTDIAPEVGIRTGPRPIGKVILKAADVLQAKKIKDCIARSAWPIEKWSVDQPVEMTYLPCGEYYEIPSGCLQSKDINNLFFAGRMISADDTAIASARVIGVCLQTGYAAGVLASSQISRESQQEAISFIQSKQIIL